MSILSELDNMVLRSTSNPPMTTKGSELTFQEMDERIIAIYDAVQSIVSGVNVTTYDAGKTYDMFDTDIRNRYVSYDSRIWEAAYVGSPSTFSGQTPEEGIYWTQVTLAELMPNILPLARVSQNLNSELDPCPTYCASLAIASSDVLQLNSTPQTIVAAQGAGTAIQVISASVKIDFNSAAYATNTDIQLKTASATVQQGNTSINSTVSQIGKFRLTEIGSPTGTQILENQPLQVTVGTGDPTAGDSDIEVYVLYRVITL